MGRREAWTSSSPRPTRAPVASPAKATAAAPRRGRPRLDREPADRPRCRRLDAGDPALRGWRRDAAADRRDPTGRRLERRPQRPLVDARRVAEVGRRLLGRARADREAQADAPRRAAGGVQPQRQAARRDAARLPLVARDDRDDERVGRVAHAEAQPGLARNGPQARRPLRDVAVDDSRSGRARDERQRGAAAAGEHEQSGETGETGHGGARRVTHQAAPRRARQLRNLALARYGVSYTSTLYGCCRMVTGLSGFEAKTAIITDCVRSLLSPTIASALPVSVMPYCCCAT